MVTVSVLGGQPGPHPSHATQAEGRAYAHPPLCWQLSEEEGPDPETASVRGWSLLPRAPGQGLVDSRPGCSRADTPGQTS